MKLLLSFLTAIIFFGCVCSKDYENSLDQDFLSDLASENNRIAGDLYLDFFNEDLSNLTYDYYLTFITKNEAPSAKGFSIMVKQADYHYFEAHKELFIIALYYKKDNTIICDNSNTAFMDSLHIYGNNDTIPELKTFVEKWINR